MSNLTVHMVVKNEDRYIWYAISAVINHVDSLLITDTGSTDKTRAIISSFKNKKIRFQKVNAANPEQITAARQTQLESTRTDWLWIVDGDEIYNETLNREILNAVSVKGNLLEGIVVGRYDLLGDLYHYQDDSAGYYEMMGEKGHFALRLINKNKLPGLHLQGIYPLEGYYDAKSKELIYHDPDKFYFTKNSLHHAMYLSRSSTSAISANTFNRLKYKFETGKAVPASYIPEVFQSPNPFSGPDILAKRSAGYEFTASLVTPLKKLKRILF